MHAHTHARKSCKAHTHAQLGENCREQTLAIAQIASQLYFFYFLLTLNCTVAPHSPLPPRPVLSLCSAERKQPLSYVPERRSVHSQWLQQRAGHVVDGFAVQPAAPASLRRPAAVQVEALPDDAAAVRQRYIAGDWGAGAQPRAGSCSKFLFAPFFAAFVSIK